MQQQQQQLPHHQNGLGRGSSSSSSVGKRKKQSAAAAAAAAAYEKLVADLEAVAAGQEGNCNSSNGSNTVSLAVAIEARLQFQKLLLQGMVKLKQRGLQDLDAASKCFSKALDKLAIISSSLNLARDADLGRDENINSHLVPAVPPRVVPVYTTSQAVQFFESLLQQLVRVCGIAHVDR
jgi:hypothetical protein